MRPIQCLVCGQSINQAIWGRLCLSCQAAVRRDIEKPIAEAEGASSSRLDGPSRYLVP